MRMKSFLALTVLVAGCTAAAGGAELTVRFSADVESSAQDGRVIVLLSTDGETEPRFQVRPGYRAVQLFGVDVLGLQPGEPAVIDAEVFGYPVASLRVAVVNDTSGQLFFLFGIEQRG